MGGVRCAPSHPLYTGGLAILIAIGLMAESFALLGIACLAAILVRQVVIPHEEANLEARFGEAYRDYDSRTGRLLPRFSRARR